MKKEKFVMLHVNEEDCKTLLNDVSNKESVERGLFVRSSIPLELISTFEQVKNRGYFPIGVVIDDSNNMEILFKRHPNQTEEMKMTEFKHVNPNVL